MYLWNVLFMYLCGKKYLVASRCHTENKRKFHKGKLFALFPVTFFSLRDKRNHKLTLRNKM